MMSQWYEIDKKQSKVSFVQQQQVKNNEEELFVV